MYTINIHVADIIFVVDNTLPANCTNGQVRLVGGSAENEGRVEICINEAWGSICPSSWDIRDVSVVCKQLG